jgi:DNA-binding CsgD family transcriptional regulator
MIELFQIDKDKSTEAQIALQVLENTVINMLDACHFGILLFDNFGNCLGLNKSWQRFFLLDFEQMKDYNILEDYGLKEKHIWDAIRRSFEGEAGIIADNYFDPEEWGKKGRGCWTRGHALPLFNQNKRIAEQIGEVLILEDASVPKATQQELKNLSEKLAEIKSVQEDICEKLATIQSIEKRILNTRPKCMPPTIKLREKAPLIPRREREVFEKLASGLTVKEAAHVLRLGVKSVYTYRSRLLNRLNLSSDVELAIAWREIFEVPVLSSTSDID